jgi:hypothetical protein
VYFAGFHGGLARIALFGRVVTQPPPVVEREVA